MMSIGELSNFTDMEIANEFVVRTWQRLKQKHPEIRPNDVSVSIEVRVPNAAMRIQRLLDDIAKEGW